MAIYTHILYDYGLWVCMYIYMKCHSNIYFERCTGNMSCATVAAVTLDTTLCYGYIEASSSSSSSGSSFLVTHTIHIT